MSSSEHLIFSLQHNYSVSGQRSDSCWAGHVDVQLSVPDPDRRQVERAAGPSGQALPGGDGGPGVQQDAAPGAGQAAEATHRHHGPHQGPGHHPLQLQADASRQV